MEQSLELHAQPEAFLDGLSAGVAGEFYFGTTQLALPGRSPFLLFLFFVLNCR